jgi:hypothetical protein
MSEAHPERDAMLVNERVRGGEKQYLEDIRRRNACIRVVKHGQYYCFEDIIRG